MSSFNVSDFDVKRVESSFVIPTIFKGNDSFNLKSNNQSHNTIGSIQHVVGDSIDYDKQKRSLDLQDNEAFIRRAFLNKRYRRSLDHGIRDSSIVNLRNQNQYTKPNFTRGSSAFNGNEMKSSYINYRKMSCFQEMYNDQSFELFSVNNAKKLLIDPHSVNGSLHKVTYNNNGTQPSKTKTTSSFGSSYPILSLSQSAIIPSTSSQNIYSTTINEYHNKSKEATSYLLQNGGDIQVTDHNGLDNRTIINSGYYINNDPMQFVDLNNLSYRNNNIITKIADRKDSIPEGLEPDTRPSLIDSSSEHLKIQSTTDMYSVNIPSYINRDETQTIVAAEHRNSVPYLSPSMQLFMYSNGTMADSRNINIHPQFRLAYSNDPLIGNSSTTTDHSNKNQANVGYMLPPQDPTRSYYYAPTIVDCQQLSSNGEISAVNDHSMTTIDTEVPDDIPVFISRTPSISETTIVGKFTVTRSEDNEILLISPKKNDISKGDVERDHRIPSNIFKKSEQPRSRFKKTRIRETVERWHTNGLSISDRRSKVIPTKIIELQGKNPEYMNEDYQINLCQDCECHDSGYRCHSDRYYNKEFLFWENGERNSVCGSSDHNADIYCPFHAKFLKLLNQNQNLSLSKFVPQYFDMAPSSILSSPPTIQATFISSSDIDPHLMNTDDPFSAPPASPSMMSSSFSNPNLDYNLQSGPSIVMVRCQTPILMTSALMNESSTVRRRSSSRMSSETDNNSTIGHQVHVTDNNSMVDMLRTSDFVSFPGPSPSHGSGRDRGSQCATNDTAYNGQQSVYYVNQIPQIHCPSPQPVIPSSLPIMFTDKQARDSPVNLVQGTLSSNIINQIDDSLNSLKTMIHNLVLSEQKPLIDEIRSLVTDNRNLKSELARVKKRSEYLESILKEHNIASDIFVGHDNSSMPNLSVISPDYHGNDNDNDVVDDDS